MHEVPRLLPDRAGINEVLYLTGIERRKEPDQPDRPEYGWKTNTQYLTMHHRN